MTKVDVDGEEKYVLTTDLDSFATAEHNGTLRLLGGFDQWVLGPGTDDTHVIPPGRRTAVSRIAGWIAPLVVVGGVVRGTWSIDGDRVTVDWFAESGKPPAGALGKEVDRLSGLVGRSLSLEVTAS